MIKWTLQFIAIFVVAFISGLYGFSFFGDKIWEDDNLILMKIETPSHAQILVRAALKNIELTDSANTDEIYKNSCQTLMLFTEHLRPEYYKKSPSMENEIRQLQEDAIKAEKRLRDSGLCYE